MNDTTLAKHELAADFRDVMTDIDALMTATTNQSEGQASELRARIGDKLGAARHLATDTQHEAVERARRAADAIDTYVHEHPWQAMGLAATVGGAVGGAIGLLIARR